MSTPLGRGPLQRLLSFVTRGWFRTEIPRALEVIEENYRLRNEILGGGIVQAGAALAAGTLALTMDALTCVLNGRVMAVHAAETNVDFLVAAGNIGTPIFEDGTSAASLLLATDETAYCTLIETNSNDAGEAETADNGTPLGVIVVAGTASTYASQTAFSSSQDIQAALEASTPHEGVTGWAHVAQILFANPGGTPGITVTANRNNVVARA